MKAANIFFYQLLNLVDRDFRNNRFYTFINISGLAFGLCCATFILLFLQDELTYDLHHKKHERIHRLESDFTVSGRNNKAAHTAYTFGPYFKQLFPEVESFVRIKKADPMAARAGNKEFFEENLFYADSTVFNIFTHEFIYGEPENALGAPYSIVLCKNLSERYFGDEDPCGNYIVFGDGSRCMVTAVIDDPPGNSHLRFDALISMGTHAKLIGEDVFKDLETRQPWAMRLYTYILLEENASIQSVHQNFHKYYDQHMAELSKRFNGSYRLMSTPLKDIHLNTELEADLPTGDKQTLYLFAAIGVFILIIASINYMNLATARSAGKAKEIGIRKLCGANRSQLVSLIISESVILSLIALALALTIADLMMPWFNEISGKSLILIESLKDPVLYILLLTAVLLGILSGIYPAFYLATFKPSNVLYNKIFMVSRRGFPRKLLMLFQFIISLALMIGTIIVHQQLVHVKSKATGFDKENVILVLSSDTIFHKSYPMLRSELMKIGGVENVASSYFVTGFGASMDIMLVEDETRQSQQLLHLNYITQHYVDLMGMEVIQGRNFDINKPSDAERYVLINETAVSKLGWKEDPIGKKITPSDRPDQPYRVIGVLRDFHFAPLHQEIAPMVYFLKKEGQPVLSIKIAETGQARTLKKIEASWKHILPHLPFTYNYLEDALESIYTSEENLLRLMGLFTVFSIFIALLGLFSLSSYLTEQYTRVIGIKKVFGASSLSIVFQLSRQHFTLILLACIISVPLCWYLMDMWLNQFAYRTPIKAQWFILSTGLMLLLAELTVIFQSIKAANRNPVDSLRYE